MICRNFWHRLLDQFEYDEVLKEADSKNDSFLEESDGKKSCFFLFDHIMKSTDND